MYFLFLIFFFHKPVNICGDSSRHRELGMGTCDEDGDGGQISRQGWGKGYVFTPIDHCLNLNMILKRPKNLSPCFLFFLSATRFCLYDCSLTNTVSTTLNSNGLLCLSACSFM